MDRIHRRSRLSPSIQVEFIKYFCVGSTARSAAKLSGINRNTAVLFFHKLREVIFKKLEHRETGLMSGKIKLDESCFCGKRIRQTRAWCGRDGYVHAMIILNASSKTIFPIIREKVKPNLIVYADSFKAYDVLNVSEFRHYRINHSELFADRCNHIKRGE